ncbi:MAG: hypothetical protein HYX84_07065 [Chloroflexi bacterium]|nr:hypothetical protein [Chloroflexota bacterium]
MDKSFIEGANDLLEKWESQRESLWAKYQQLENELQDLDMHIKVMHDAISDHMKDNPATIATPSNIKPGSISNKSYPEMLIEIARQSQDNNRIWTVEAMTDIISEVNIGVDRETVRHNVDNTLSRLHKLGRHFVRIDRGQYRYTNHVQPEKVRETKKTSVKRIRERSGVRDAVKALKDKNPQMSKKDVLNHLLESGFDFQGKRPASAVNFSWGYWGYSKEGKQQPLPEPQVSTPKNF